MTTEALPKPHLPPLNPGGPVNTNLLREHRDSFNLALEPLGPAEILRWAARTFGARAALSCSFGGPSGMVLIDLIAAQSLPIDVYSIDPGLLFPETHDLAREVERRYGIRPRRFFPDLTLAEHAAAHEDKPWQVDPDACCARRKLEPNRRALAGRSAWISGVRRNQSTARAETPTLSWSEKFNIFKLAPLARWTEDEVWDHIRKHDVPYNALHERGMPSLGCTVCTAIPDGIDPRSGRWPGFTKTECGLHI